MLYVVGYRGYEIFRDVPTEPFKIRKCGETSGALPGNFYSFTAAREHVDGLIAEGRYWAKNG